MPFPNQITSQSNATAVVNEELATLAHQACYGKKASTTTGLTWGYYGGRWGGFAVSDGTLSLAASSTNYVVVAVATGVVSVSTSASNWNDTDNYVRVYKVTTAASTVSGTPEDHRSGPGGVHGGAPGGPGIDPANRLLTINSQATSYTLVLTDADTKMVVISDASANNLTVPPNASVAFPVGTTILLKQGGAGQTTVVAGSGVTVNVRAALTLKLAGQYALATLIKEATDTWVLGGDLEPA